MALLLASPSLRSLFTASICHVSPICSVPAIGRHASCAGVSPHRRSSPSLPARASPLSQLQQQQQLRKPSTMAPVPSTMNAVQIARNGGVEVLEHKAIPVPTLGPGQVLVRNRFAGVNFIDTYFRTGLYPSPHFPLTLGREGAGEVVAAHASVTDLQPGTRVVYMTGPGAGAYAQYAAVDAAKAVVIPDSISDQQAAAVLLQGLTAWTFIHEAGDVQPGQWALVHAAAGGVGLLLVQMLRSVGAKVIGTAGSKEKCELARKNGAEWTIDSRNDDVVAKVKDITGGHGVDVIFDGVGKATFDADLQMIAMKGHLISFGNASGAVPPVNILQLGPKNVKLMRPVVNGYVAERKDLERYTSALFDLVASGNVNVAIHQRSKVSSHVYRVSAIQIQFPPFAIPFRLIVHAHLGLGLDRRQQLRRGLLSVALGVVVHPSPQVLAGLFHGELRLPLELLVGQRRVGSQVQHVALSAGNDLVLEVAANDGAERLDHLEDGAAAAGAQVPGLDAGLVLAEVVEGDEVALCQVDNVDVVADGSSVARGVVYYGGSQLLAVARRHLAQQGQQVVGHALGVLAHDAAGVGAAWVKVAQQGAVPLLEGLAGLLEVAALGVDAVGDDVLDHRLGAAVGVGGADRAVLGDGDHVGEARCVAVDGGRRGEDDVGDVVALHGPQEGDAAADVDALRVSPGRGKRATHLEGGEVNDAVNCRVLGKHVVKGLFVGHVDLVKVGPAAAEQLDAVDGDLGRVVEADDNDDIVAVLEQREGGEGANVARATWGTLAGGPHRKRVMAGECHVVPGDENRSHSHCALT
ncbi:putative quinone oxidoreductase [Tolypocladium ophioglossoides CBS 100239]|uniref:Probable quinone oxidoreductase n=1 Tax=Tolypocladium ophioglossoides (strain CBS 100239) TaxID=1163406 RepID=A0A0L0NED3_TOLOC|nr:putative quinone oxidoreductase [Tolypocladium ophioglossoides CBS 100239]